MFITQPVCRWVHAVIDQLNTFPLSPCLLGHCLLQPGYCVAGAGKALGSGVGTVVRTVVQRLLSVFWMLLAAPGQWQFFYLILLRWCVVSASSFNSLVRLWSHSLCVCFIFIPSSQWRQAKDSCGFLQQDGTSWCLLCLFSMSSFWHGKPPNIYLNLPVLQFSKGLTVKTFKENIFL